MAEKQEENTENKDGKDKKTGSEDEFDKFQDWGNMEIPEKDTKSPPLFCRHCLSPYFGEKNVDGCYVFTCTKCKRKIDLSSEDFADVPPDEMSMYEGDVVSNRFSPLVVQQKRLKSINVADPDFLDDGYKRFYHIYKYILDLMTGTVNSMHQILDGYRHTYNDAIIKKLAAQSENSDFKITVSGSKATNDLLLNPDEYYVPQEIIVNCNHAGKKGVRDADLHILNSAIPKSMIDQMPLFQQRLFQYRTRAIHSQMIAQNVHKKAEKMNKQLSGKKKRKNRKKMKSVSDQNLDNWDVPKCCHYKVSVIYKMSKDFSNKFGEVNNDDTSGPDLTDLEEEKLDDLEEGKPETDGDDLEEEKRDADKNATEDEQLTLTLPTEKDSEIEIGEENGMKSDSNSPDNDVSIATVKDDTGSDEEKKTSKSDVKDNDADVDTKQGKPFDVSKLAIKTESDQDKDDPSYQEEVRFIKPYVMADIEETEDVDNYTVARVNKAFTEFVRVLKRRSDKEQEERKDITLKYLEKEVAKMSKQVDDIKGGIIHDLQHAYRVKMIRAHREKKEVREAYGNILTYKAQLEEYQKKNQYDKCDSILKQIAYYKERLKVIKAEYDSESD